MGNYRRGYGPALIVTGTVLVVWILGWGLVFLGLAALGSANCPDPQGGSNDGYYEWSYQPWGPECTYTEQLHGENRADPPAPLLQSWPYVVSGLVLVIIVLHLIGHGRTTDGSTAQDEPGELTLHP